MLHPTETISFAFQIFKNNFLKFLGIIMLSVAIQLFPLLVYGQSISMVLMANLVSYLLLAVYGMGVIRVNIQAVDGKHFDVLDVLRFDFKTLIQFSFVLFLYVIGCIIGLILLVIPFVIFSLVYFFSNYLVIDQQTGVLEAFSKSAEITKGNRINLGILLLVLTFLNIGGALFFGIGLLLTIPISWISLAHAYRQLLPLNAPNHWTPDTQPEPQP